MDAESLKTPKGLVAFNKAETKKAELHKMKARAEALRKQRLADASKQAKKTAAKDKEVSEHTQHHFDNLCK
jgi:hypothetical protein